MNGAASDVGREVKPRSFGLTSLIDTGYPTRFFCDVLQSHSPLIDMVKFGWATSLVTKDIERKVAALKESAIPFHLGGTLFEKYFIEGKFDVFVDLVQKLNAEWVEVSDGIIDLAAEQKLESIRVLSNEFSVVSEVGYKDVDRSLSLSPKRWIEKIEADLSAGARYVVLEARESGTSGICRRNGEVRFGLIEEILESGVDTKRLIFEAPNKTLQTYFVERVGCNVNLGNIGFLDVVGVETLRRGLRAETLRTDSAQRTDSRLWRSRKEHEELNLSSSHSV